MSASQSSETAPRSRSRFAETLSLIPNAEFQLLWDVCASHDSALPLYRTAADGLSADWRGRRVWMHPPDGAPLGPWVAKAATGGAEICVCLLPAQIEADWFADHVCNNPAAEIRFVHRRPCRDGHADMQGMIVIFRRPQ
jgi:hypothetical protein